MDKILIEINKGKISFSYCSENETDGEFSSITTNGINRIISTKDYIDSKMDLFITFINQTNNKHKIEEIVIDKFALSNIVFNLLKEINIPLLKFNEQGNLPDEICEKIKNVQNLECYSMSKEMYENLSKVMNVTIQNTLLFNSKLMNHNNFQTYSDLYDKEEIDIDFNPENDDLDDLNSLLETNHNIKTINIKKYYDNIVQKVLKVLIQNKKEDILINIYEHDEDIIKEIPNLKKLNKKVKKYFKLKIIYSDEYKKKYFKKQIIRNLLIFIFIASIIAFIVYFILN